MSAPPVDAQSAHPAQTAGADTDAGVPALELRDVRASYGRIEVLHGVSLTVPFGSVFALLGPNGAGKTTTLAVVSGQLQPTSGCVHIVGRHVNGLPPDALARAGICEIPEGRGIFPNLTVAENVRVYTYAAGRSAEDAQEATFTRFPLLADRRDQLAGTLSGGEQQMLAMARALIADADLLLLDEISMGLAPKIVDELYRVVVQLAAEGIAVVLVEQFAHKALAVADYAAVMAQGCVTTVGQPSDVRDFLSHAYLGGAA